MLFFNFKLTKSESLFREIASSSKEALKQSMQSKKGLYFTKIENNYRGIYISENDDGFRRGTSEIIFFGKIKETSKGKYFKGIIFLDPIVCLCFIVLLLSLLTNTFQSLGQNDTFAPLNLVFLAAFFFILYGSAKKAFLCYKELESIV